MTLMLVATLLLNWPAPKKYNLMNELTQRSPAEFTRYLLMRLEGHSKLQVIAHPLLLPLQRHLEKPIPFPPTDAQRIGKGQQALPLPTQKFTASQRATPVDALVVHGKQLMPLRHTVQRREWLATSSATLIQAMAQAQPGDTITLQAGDYAVGGALQTGHAGTPAAPIFVRSEIPGSTHLRLSSYFYVAHPFWVFENLHLQGNCSHGEQSGPREHAFHVVGLAKGTVIGNNHIENFFAHIKVNGLNGKFPDGGLLQFNTFSNNDNYEVKGALSPLDLVGASNWTVADNLVHHFVKAWSPHASYGIFMKGGGHAGRIERNLVICSGDGNISHYGSRVGISLGGGLTGPEYCPNKKCLYEHADGVVANNVVMNCNDYGVDNNRSARSIFAHNTLIKTHGIDVRDVPSFSWSYGNHLSGYLIAKRGGELREEGNDDSLGVVDYVNALLSQTTVPISDHLASTHPAVRDDFCGHRRAASSQPGALTRPATCQAP